MKKIVLFLAALAALASCVKENNLHPEQTSDNLVTIKAVSADTKTLLDGTDVVWEADDAIKVVYRGTSETFMTDFSVDGSVNGSSATFKGVFDHSVESDRNPYAVYPASSVTEDAGTGSAGTGNVAITHSLSEVQDGTIASGMNLSSAILSADDMAAGTATAVFNNALTLLQIVVPEGVKSVALTANYGLVGDATFTVDDKDSQGEPTGDNDDNGNPIYEKISATGKLTTNGGDKETVTLQDGDGALAAKTHSVLVYPGSNTDLKVTVTGTDGTEYTNTVGVKFSAGEYRTLDLTKLFNMAIEEEEVKPVSPMGETFSFEVVAAEQYEYEVVIEGNPAWITLNENAHVTSKAFVGTTVSFTVDANTTGSPREANVTITWNDGEEQSRYFKVTQVSAYLDFVYVDPTADEKELIKWEETFGVFSDEALTTNVKDFTNTFTIDLSEDPSKGTYVLENLFVYDNGVSKVGGTYYADFNSTENELTVYTSTAAAPSCTYYFDDTVVLVYNPSTKTFSSKLTAFKANTKYDFYGYANKDAFIGNYEAHHYVAPDPGTGDESIQKYIGIFAESSFSSTSNMLTPGVLKIEASDDSSKGLLKITSIFGTTPTNMYASVSDGVITTDANASINSINGSNPIGALTLNISNDGVSINMTQTTIGGWMTISNYSAYKVIGQYTESSFSSTSNMLTPGVLKIEASDDSSKGLLKITSIFGTTPTNMYASISNGVITTDANASINTINGSNAIGSLNLTYSMVSEKLTIAMNEVTIGGWMTISNYTATKQ